MIDINLINGELKYGEYLLVPKGKFDYFRSLFLSTEMELWTSNKNFTSYRLNLSDEFIFILYFLNEELKTIDIYPKNKRNEISLLLENLRGEHFYSWGKVELNNDIKAGYKSVLVKYN